jgi:N-acetylneuraminate lyase
MNADGSVNYSAFAIVMQDNIDRGVHGFWTAGGTGESVLLADDEIMKIAEISAKLCRKAGVLNIMHVGAITTARSVALAKHAAKVGCDAICAVPPFFYNAVCAHL